MELKRVVVTGLGALTPVGNNVAETWENLVKGISGAGPITHFDASKFKTHFACEVKNFNGTDYIDRKELRKMDLYTQYAIAAAKEAVEDSGMDLEKEDLNRIGVIYGVGIGGIHTFEEEVANYTLNKDTVGPKFNPFFIPKMIADIASGQISIMYGFHGPNFTTTSACASSSNAIADAFNYIRLGKANVIVAGGAEAAIFEEVVNDPSGRGYGYKLYDSYPDLFKPEGDCSDEMIFAVQNSGGVGNDSGLPSGLYMGSRSSFGGGWNSRTGIERSSCNHLDVGFARFG